MIKLIIGRKEVKDFYYFCEVEPDGPRDIRDATRYLVKKAGLMFCDLGLFC